MQFPEVFSVLTRFQQSRQAGEGEEFGGVFDDVVVNSAGLDSSTPEPHHLPHSPTHSKASPMSRVETFEFRKRLGDAEPRRMPVCP
eukprot:2932600-Rhodomonas_salina.2